MRLPVMVECPSCGCQVESPDGWDTDDLAVVGPIARIVGEGWGIPQGNGARCVGTCSCHTGVGLLAPLRLFIDPDRDPLASAGEVTELADYRTGAGEPDPEAG